ncbi:FtsX-like permease family [Dorea longicatena]|nr:FtsX-like permease family [Dorea longicatena]
MQRAIGMSSGSLYKTFLWEGAYYGVIASVIGSVLGYVCTIFIEAATSDTSLLAGNSNSTTENFKNEYCGFD